MKKLWLLIIALLNLTVGISTQADPGVSFSVGFGAGYGGYYGYGPGYYGWRRPWGGPWGRPWGWRGRYWGRPYYWGAPNVVYVAPRYRYIRRPIQRRVIRRVPVRRRVAPVRDYGFDYSDFQAEETDESIDQETLQRPDREQEIKEIDAASQEGEVAV